jgi:hypothetical protein
MAIAPGSHTLAKPWRKSEHSGGGNCVEIAVMPLVRSQASVTDPPMVFSGEPK